MSDYPAPAPVSTYRPVRKVLAACITALVATPILVAFVADRSPELAAALAAVLPIVAAYLASSEPSGSAGSGAE